MTESRVFGRYRLLERLAAGGMAEVFLAAEGETEARVVIKRIRPDFAADAEFTSMFQREAELARALDHPNIVRALDFGRVGEALYFAMEWIDGLDLMQLFRAARAAGVRIPPALAAHFGREVAAALAYVHEKRDAVGHLLGIVHRDISPHNVMVSHAGRVKILDFGIAHAAGARTEAALIQGKLAYMSPEQAHGLGTDARSDVYSLGIVLHELLSGTLLFRHRDRNAALEAVRFPVLPRLSSTAPHVPRRLVEIVERAVAREPARRHPTARELGRELAAFLDEAGPVDDAAVAVFVQPLRDRVPPRSARSEARADRLRPACTRLRETFTAAVRDRRLAGVLVREATADDARTLVDAFVAMLPPRTVWVLRGQPRSDRPFDVVLDAVANGLGLVAPIDAIEAKNRLEAHGFTDAGALAHALAHGDPRPEDLERWFAALIQRRPVLLVAERLAAHDRDSAARMEAWIGARTPWPMLLVVTAARGGAVPPAWPDVLELASLHAAPAAEVE